MRCRRVGYPASPRTRQPLEYQVKAAFLLNFTKFVQWPATAFADEHSPLAICILGEDPFGNTLNDMVKGEAVNGHELVIQRIRRTIRRRNRARFCLSRDRKKRRARILAELGPGVLTVGEGEKVPAGWRHHRFRHRGSPRAVRHRSKRCGQSHAHHQFEADERSEVRGEIAGQIMHPFRDMPIKQKLMVIIMSVTTAALLLSGLGIVIADSILFRAATQRDISALAQIVADNSTAALAFNDPQTATQTLASLKARPHLLAACIYQPDATIFATYIRPGSGAECQLGNGPDELRFTSDRLTIRRPIELNQRRIGTLVLPGRSGCNIGTRQTLWPNRARHSAGIQPGRFPALIPLAGDRRGTDFTTGRCNALGIGDQGLQHSRAEAFRR